MLKNQDGDKSVPTDQPKKPLTEPAKRALKEAADRRNSGNAAKAEKETGGREGPDPARYGDWEVKGIASDF
jgi:hypothetical protein